MSRSSDDAVMSRKVSSSAPLCVVAARDFDRIAGIAQFDEIDALDDATCGHVKARDDALGQHRRPGSRTHDGVTGDRKTDDVLLRM